MDGLLCHTSFILAPALRRGASLVIFLGSFPDIKSPEKRKGKLGFPPSFEWELRPAIIPKVFVLEPSGQVFSWDKGTIA
jgi:hypothetical protein